MTVARLALALDDIAPLALAEPWDNVGLLLGDHDAPLAGPILLTIDLTPAVLREALEARCAAVVAYHPPIFHPLKRITRSAGAESVLFDAARAGLAICSPHTALDAAKGGLADWLADGVAGATSSGGATGNASGGASGDAASAGSVSGGSVSGGSVSGGSVSGGAEDRRALIPALVPDPMQTHKVVVYVPLEPADALEKVRNALASAGAGHIGEYSLCSFTLTGAGTFMGSAKSNPVVGRRGALETVAEARLEMVCPGAAVPVLIETLRAFHPYEEPAFDIYQLVGKPDRRVGAGRRLTLDQPATPETIAQRLKTHLRVQHVALAESSRAHGAGKPVTRIAVCPGSGAGLLDAAIAQNCELFITGEMKHHETLRAVSAGCSVITAGHTTTERGYLPVLARRLRELLPGTDVRVSAEDREPMRVV